MSTPPSTETFVSGDRVSYRNKNSGITYTGTLGEPHPTVEGWRYIKVDGHGTCILPVEYMSKVDIKHCQKLDLPPISQEDLTKHYEIQKREIVQWISRRLEERIEDWHERSMTLEEVAENPELDVVYGFDQGYVAGIRAALGITEDMMSRLDK
ncbi:hypothetical protein SEA_ATUIN_302 [Arthrobacter phage Atuin]|nr:hypothetical protein SEA_ATUIN_101 [Arthrobacter phage Atuin]